MSLSCTIRKIFARIFVWKEKKRAYDCAHSSSYRIFISSPTRKKNFSLFNNLWIPISSWSFLCFVCASYQMTASWHARTQVLIISFLFFAQQLKEIDRLVNLLLYFLFSFFCLAGYKSLYYSILDHSSRKKFSLSLYLSLCVWYFWCNGGHGSIFGCRWT